MQHRTPAATAAPTCNRTTSTTGASSATSATGATTTTTTSGATGLLGGNSRVVCAEPLVHAPNQRSEGGTVAVGWRVVDVGAEDDGRLLLRERASARAGVGVRGRG
jgi:hypothetical protein